MQDATHMWWATLSKALMPCVTLVLVAFSIYDPTDVHRERAYIAGAALVFLIGLMIEWRATVTPVRHIESVRAALLDQYTARLLASLRKKGLIIRMNLMVPRSRPQRFFFRYFKIVWQAGMLNQPDVNLRIPIKCGVVGEVFRGGRPVGVPHNATAYKFPAKLAPAVADVTAIFSYPVYEPADGRRGQSGKIVGVLSLDSKSAGAFELLNTAPLGSRVDRRMVELARIASQLVL